MVQLGTYVAECAAPALNAGDLRDLHAALELTTARLSAAGQHVVYLRSGYFPDEGRWTAVFLADDPGVVRHIAHIAQLRSVDVHRAVELVSAVEDKPVRPSTSVERNPS